MTHTDPLRISYTKSPFQYSNIAKTLIFTKHIPKQKEINEFLQILKAKVTKDYKLPLLAKSIIAAYAQSPAFKSIYQYITTNTLPLTEDFKDELYVMLIITLLLMAYFLSYSKLTGTNN